MVREKSEWIYSAISSLFECTMRNSVLFSTSQLPLQALVVKPTPCIFFRIYIYILKQLKWTTVNKLGIPQNIYLN